MSTRVLVTGATGLLGKRLVAQLQQDGDEVVAISRDVASARRTLGDGVTCFEWDYGTEPFPADALAGVTTVFHLMGENIGTGRWTTEKKKALRDSRIESTRKLVDALPDSVVDFLCASAIGIYPGTGDEPWDEHTRLPEPASFMTRLCTDWEKVAAKAATTERRHASLRIGLVLGEGGMLAPLVPLYRLGLGGPMGSGTQVLPWIHADDTVDAMLHVRVHRELDGAVNLVGPAPVALETFSASLAEVLHRPHLFRVPAFAIRLALGEASALLLSSYNILPTRLEKSGFTFRHTTHFGALEAVVRDCY